MGSTGVYGKPVFNILESGVHVIVVNAEPIKQKQDVREIHHIDAGTAGDDLELVGDFLSDLVDRLRTIP
jgi:hypothetical protein